jgi:hypothetical protein
MAAQRRVADSCVHARHMRASPGKRRHALFEIGLGVDGSHQDQGGMDACAPKPIRGHEVHDASAPYLTPGEECRLVAAS